MEENNPCRCSRDLFWNYVIFLAKPSNRLSYILDETRDKYIEDCKMLVHENVGSLLGEFVMKKLTLLNFY